MRTTESQSTTETKLKRIAWLSARDKGKQFGSLLHHINESSLKECFYQLSANRAVGVDGQRGNTNGSDTIADERNIG